MLFNKKENEAEEAFKKQLAVFYYFFEILLGNLNIF